ncbi:MAG TPA: ABC transporter ATP-binding protein [Gemmatimonadaceae bacterium]
MSESPLPGLPIAKLLDVHVHYGEVEALAGVTLDVRAGALTALVGRNGAGKTTMVNVLAGLLAVDTGEVELFGHSWLNPADSEYLRGDVGFLLSDPSLFQYLTAAETLEFLAAAYGLHEDVARARVADLLQFFDLDEVRDRMCDELSTGMRKRLALAAAVVHAPRLLVLDEPFESLDPLIVRRLRRLLVRYVRAGGSVLLSSHLVDVIQEIADHVYILEQGQIVFEGPGSQFRTRMTPSDEGGALETKYASLVEQKEHVGVDWLAESTRRTPGQRESQRTRMSMPEKS